MFLIIDNYDSFVHNLARYFVLAEEKTEIIRNDALSVREIAQKQPDALIISPGPCSPQEAGITIEAIQVLAGSIPILGVCLGHQAIGDAFGSTTVRSHTPRHGKTSMITHEGTGLFVDIPSPFKAARYHSLISSTPGKDSPLKITATSDDGFIMGLQHESWPVYGVQFHPESILTDHGMQIVRNFVEIAQDWNASRRKHIA